MVFNVVGKQQFTAKSGKECYVLQVTSPFYGDSPNCIGERASQQFVNQVTYSRIPVPCKVDMNFDNRGFLVSCDVVK